MFNIYDFYEVNLVCRKVTGMCIKEKKKKIIVRNKKEGYICEGNYV